MRVRDFIRNNRSRIVKGTILGGASLVLLGLGASGLDTEEVVVYEYDEEPEEVVEDGVEDDGHDEQDGAEA